MGLSDDVEERFLSKVDKSGPDGEHADGACWQWTTDTDIGYGQLNVDGKCVVAHRVAAKLYIDESIELAPGRTGENYVLHQCHNPSCVNPDHLYIGTQADNMQDTLEIGTHDHPDHVGEDNPASKLTEADVVEIRERYSCSSVTYTELADEYGISMCMVGNIVRGDAWESAGGPVQ